MEGFYLDQYALSYLAQLIFALAMTLYLVSLRQKEETTWLFLFFFASITAYAGVSLIEAMSLGLRRFYAVHLQMISLCLAITALLQFAYRFPALPGALPLQRIRREAQLVRWLSLLATAQALGWGLYQFSQLTPDRMPTTNTWWTDVWIACSTTWLCLTCWRRAWILSREAAPTLPWWHHIVRPQGRLAQGAFTLALVLVLAVVLGVFTVLQGVALAFQWVLEVFPAYGILVLLFGIGITFFNYTPQVTSFMAKLVGISLVTILLVLGLVGALVAPYYAEAFSGERPTIEPQTLHFEPDTTTGGYRVTRLPVRFESDVGQMTPTGVASLPFLFPFFDRTWDALYLHIDGSLTFGQWNVMARAYNLRPAMYVLDVPEHRGLTLFTRATPDSYIITWESAGPTPSDPLIQVQAVFFADGSFELNYPPIQNVWVQRIGIQDGRGSPQFQPLDFSASYHQTPLTGAGLMIDYIIQRRLFIHERLVPLAALIVGASLFILLGFPLFFFVILINPLNELIRGVHAVNQGNLQVSVPVHFPDEIGFVTEAFNQMVTSVRLAGHHLEGQVIERTRDLAEAKAVAEAASRAKTNFLANMSHELRTPLNGILGYAQILNRDPLLTETQRTGVTTIYNSGRHLLTLINDVLDLARIEADRLELAPTELTLTPFLNEIVDLMGMAARQAGLRFVYEVPPDLPALVLADPKRLRQVLLNLLGNAIKFTECGQVLFQVWVVEQRPPTAAGEDSRVTLRFHISDTGPGIPIRQQALIFRAFEQDSQERQRQRGAGLGLTISQQLVELMGGTIQVASPRLAPGNKALGEGGPGSSFWFQLSFPCLPKASAVAHPTPRLHIVGYEGAPRRVLVVDDQKTNRQLLYDMLAPLGFEVLLAANGQEGIAQAQATHPDLILIDLVMPIMTGFEAVPRLRQLPTLAHTPIIAISASAYTWDQRESQLVGCDAFLPKPIETEALLHLLKHHLHLEWRYTPIIPQEKPPILPQITTPSDHISPLLPPPRAELEVLYELARLGDMDHIRERVVLLGALSNAYQPFANQLDRLAQAFEDEQLIALIERYLHDD